MENFYPLHRAYIYSGSREQKRLINSRDGIHLFDRFESVYIFREQRGDGATSIVFGRNILQEIYRKSTLIIRLNWKMEIKWMVDNCSINLSRPSKRSNHR